MFIKTLGVLLALAIFLLPAAAQPPLDKGTEGLLRRGRVVIRQPSHVPQCQQGPLIIPPCPPGTNLVIFDSPVYDDDGLFVVCFKKVPYCIPSDLEPEG